MNAEQFNVWFAKTQFDTAQRLRVYAKLADLLKNKVGIDLIITDLWERASHKGEKPNEALAVVFDSWRTTIRNGGSFAEAVAEWVPPTDRMIILAGESSGTLPNALQSLIRVTKAIKKIKSVVITGLIYPFFLTLAIAGYLWMFGTKVIPEFSRMFEVHRFSPPARSLFKLSDFVIAFGPYVAAIATALVIAIVIALPRMTGTLRVRLDKIAPFSTYRLVVGAGFLFALAEMLNAGTRVKQALLDIGERSNPYIGERIDAMLQGLTAGADIGAAMADSGYDFPDREIVEDLALYAKHTGDLTDALNRVSNQWMESGVERVEVQIGVLKGLVMATLIGLLLWIVTGFFAMQQDIAALTRSMR